MGVHIAGAISCMRLNFALLRLVFVGHSLQTSGTSNFEVACSFL